MHISHRRLKQLLGLIIFAFLLTACGSNLSAEPSEEVNTTYEFEDTYFSATPPLGNAPLTVNFKTDSRSKQKRWKLRDGSVKAWGKHVKYTYRTPGTYSVTLDTSAPDSTFAQTPDAAMSITVLPNSSRPHENKPPTAFFTVSDITWSVNCPRTSIFSFDASASSDLDGEIVDYRWEFDDTAFGTGTIYGQEVSQKYAFSKVDEKPIISKVKLTVRDNKGKTSSVEMWRTFASQRPTSPKVGCADPSDPGNPN